MDQVTIVVATYRKVRTFRTQEEAIAFIDKDLVCHSSHSVEAKYTIMKGLKGEDELQISKTQG